MLMLVEVEEERHARASRRRAAAATAAGIGDGAGGAGVAGWRARGAAHRAAACERTRHCSSSSCPWTSVDDDDAGVDDAGVAVAVAVATVAGAIADAACELQGRFRRCWSRRVCGRVLQLWQ